MDDLREIFKAQKVKYPLMEGQDFLKLIYQNEMGGGHMINDESSCLKYLEEEAKEVKPCERHFDDIGNDIARVYLSDVLNRGIPMKYLSDAFIFTANKHKGSMDGLRKKINLFYEEVSLGNLDEDLEETEKLISKYSEMGFPPVHHSETFRDNYAPHYRVVYKKFAELMPLLEKIAKLKDKQDKVTILIDGRCGSGKSTYALFLKELLKCPIIHMDDFFLPESLRTEERLNEAGGNIHYEYFYENVVLPLRAGKEICYKPFDCHTMAFKEAVTVPESRFLIIEGSYSHHPKFMPYGDIKVFSTVSAELQRERLIKRNGLIASENFFTRWMPMEEKYFKAFNIEENADIVLK